MATAALLIAGCGGSAPRTPIRPVSQVASHAPDRNGAACRPSQLRITAGPRFSEATEQHTLLLVFRNISATACDMRGYPGIALYDSTGRRLSFAYWRVGDQMLTSARPALVRLPPGGYAYSAVNKNSCISFTQINAARAEVTPPGQHEALALALPYYPILSYCGASDPGHRIDIAPVEPTSLDVLADR
jgi:hypothetical protein